MATQSNIESILSAPSKSGRRNILGTSLWVSWYTVGQSFATGCCIERRNGQRLGSDIAALGHRAGAFWGAVRDAKLTDQVAGLLQHAA